MAITVVVRADSTLLLPQILQELLEKIVEM